LESEKKAEITISYTPVAAGMVSTEYFDITTVSGNSIRITCTGVGIGESISNNEYLSQTNFSQGPKVTFNTKIINFNDVSANDVVVRSLYIQNHTSITAFYQVSSIVLFLVSMALI
jgi:hypothetical protein